MRTDDEVLAEAEARLQARRVEKGKGPIPRSLLQHGVSFVLLGDVIRGMGLTKEEERKG